MVWQRALRAIIIILFALSSFGLAIGIPSGDVYPPKFTLHNNEWYDSWGFNRNYYGGSDGFLPNVAYESVGAFKELAYAIGERFETSYPQKVDRAKAILKYVQKWTDYGYDADNVYMNGIPQDEWAWNADEMVHMFNENTGTVAIGDCEDMAFLCSTIYLAAGFDVVLVSPPEHVALMIWLPEYSNANYYWDLQDGRGKGWIWVEPTGENNPLGWTPPDFTDGNFEVYSLGSSVISNVNYAPNKPQAEDDVTVTVSVTIGSSNISQILLYYSINGGAYTTLTMTLQGSSYKATIPRQAGGTVVKFYASVTDTEGNVSESSKLSYTVGGGSEIPEIPGFPIESIIIGLAIGLVTLYFLARKKSALSIPSTSAHFRS
jgi:hypothetical protein